MSHIVIASQNPVKIEATEQGFRAMYPENNFTFEGVSVESAVSEQPLSRAETLQGALNRANNAQRTMPQADYAVGIEGGLENIEGRFEVFAWVVILHNGRIGRAQTGVFYLPEEVATLIRDGQELGHADDVVFGQRNSKQSNGSIGLLTDNALTRTTYYIPAVIMALIPFKKPQFTWF